MREGKGGEGGRFDGDAAHIAWRLASIMTVETRALAIYTPTLRTNMTVVMVRFARFGVKGGSYRPQPSPRAAGRVHQKITFFRCDECV